MRLDLYLVENGYFSTRTKASQSIERGEIFVNSKQITKPAFSIDGQVVIERVCPSEYVSVGGFKLEKALKDFNFDASDMVVADVGASTGGFTDCLIKNGAKKVYSIDLRDDLLHDKLKEDNRVSLIVKNAKELTRQDFNENLDLIVADLSFISVSHVLGVFNQLIDENKDIILLIKPQFETGKKQKYKNGIIRDDKVHKQVCFNVYEQAKDVGLMAQAITSAPIVEGKNKEFLIWLKKGGQDKLGENFVQKL
jgi:23S rRNA (cytidine1920-2'-O)/16S rRNA (cytidine1409-2'-O)-methyltransferase